jgi:hypothetical protein
MVKRVLWTCVIAIWVAGLSLSAALAQADSATMSGVEMPKPAAPLSTGLVLNVDGKTTTFSVEDLKALPLKTLHVHNAHNNADEVYSGVALSDLLAKAGFVADKTTQRRMLHSFLRAEGTDKYWVLYSATEVEGSEHVGDVIVATSMGEQELGADGNFKLVSTEDKKPQRWVRNLAAITLKTAE